MRGGAIDGNTALVRGGGVLLKGNITEGSAQFESVRVSGNSAQDGGGIYADIAVFVLLASDVYENTATRNGGGIHFATRFDYPSDFVAGNWAQIEASSISKNVAGQDGGGLYNGMQLSVNNSTLSGNEAGNEGGGLFNIGGNVRFRYATVYSNAAALGGGFVNREGGRRTYGLVGGPVSLQNSIIAFNKAGSCVRIRSRLDGDFSPVTSLGYNLLDDTACPILSGIDLFEVDPMLGPLATNGATTLNHVPRFGSPAIDAIPIDGWSLLPTCRAGMDDDQRLVARPKGGGCDIGAVEFVGLIEPPQQ
jgi:predicted outer membrane repeat protein